jgi:hypothetical protein
MDFMGSLWKAEAHGQGISLSGHDAMPNDRYMIAPGEWILYLVSER